jgi:hypothetical protein
MLLGLRLRFRVGAFRVDLDCRHGCLPATPCVSPRRASAESCYKFLHQVSAFLVMSTLPRLITLGGGWGRGSGAAPQHRIAQSFGQVGHQSLALFGGQSLDDATDLADLQLLTKALFFPSFFSLARRSDCCGSFVVSERISINISATFSGCPSARKPLHLSSDA